MGSPKLKISIPERGYSRIAYEGFIDLMNNDNANTVIVDLRDDDFAGGHIKGAQQLPFSEFEFKHSQTLLEQVLKEKPKTLIFYSMTGQQRSPIAANIFHRILTEHLKKENLGSLGIEIYVLSLGFFGVLEKLRNQKIPLEESEVIEEYDSKYWDEKTKLHVSDQVFEADDE